MRPPRALWVSFELGRPLGPPDDPEFQRNVALAALKLLEAESGPILEDYPLDAPPSAGETNGWACPINFAPPPQDLNGDAALVQSLKNEVSQMRSWHERAVAARGHTSVGVSGLEVDAIANLIGELCGDTLPASPNPELSLAEVIRLAAEDLKAFYFEAASAQPGEASSTQLRSWFWQSTRAGDALRLVSKRLETSDDEALQTTGLYFIVPRAEA